MKSGRRAAFVAQRRLSRKDVRLALVDLRHLPSARLETLFDALDDRRIDFHLQPERLHQRIARHVILGRSEAAGEHEEIGALERVADLVDQIAEDVADDALARDRNRKVFERCRDLERVRVDARRPQHLRADRDDRGPHNSFSFDSASHLPYSNSIIAFRPAFCACIFFVRSPSR